MKNSSAKPLVSVVIPVYNGAEFIAETIQSVKAQTYKHWELIIVDDGSTDDTLKVIRQQKLSTSQLKVISSKNQGPGVARNKAVRAAKGEYIAFIDADDVWLPGKLSAQVTAMQQEGCDLCFTNGEFIGGNVGGVFATVHGNYTGEEMFAVLFKHNRIALLSVMIRRQSFLDVGGFEKTGPISRRCEDYDLWLRLAASGRTFFGLKDILVRYRVHPDSAISNVIAMTEAEILVVQQYKQRVVDQSPEVYRQRLVRLYDILIAETTRLSGSQEAEKYFNCIQDISGGYSVTWRKLVLRLFGRRYGGFMRRLDGVRS